MNKICTKCKVIKSIDDFGIAKRAKDGHNCMCMMCAREFGRSIYGRKYQDPVYREKFREDAKKYRLKSHKNDKITSWRRQGVIFRDDNEASYWYDLLLLDTTLCNWCGCSNSTSSRHYRGQSILLSLDHDHVTGRPRQFLCHGCNFLEGRIAKMSPEMLFIFKLRVADL